MSEAQRTSFFPKTVRELEAAGYSRMKGESRGVCRSCKQPVEWWFTPAKKLMPINTQDPNAVVSHFAECPNANQHRRRA